MTWKRNLQRDLTPKPGPDHKWCPVHKCWESHNEWIECDDELHRQGCHLVAPGIILDAQGKVIGVLDD